MMSDYSRTTELVDAAYNSAGSSQEQFEKTLDSLESILNGLQVAWTQFITTVANNQVIKTVIQLLTSLLDILNGLSNFVSGFGDIWGTLFNTALLTGGILAARKLLTSFFGWFGGFFSGEQATKTTSEFVKTFFSSLGNGFKSGKSKIKSIFSKLSDIIDNIFSKETWINEDAFFPKFKGYEKEVKQFMDDYSESFQKEYDRISQEIKSTQDLLGNKSNAPEVTAGLEKKNLELNTQLANTTQKYASALKLSETAQKEFNSLLQAGIPIQQAGILASQGMTTAQLKEIATRQLGTNATEADIQARMQQIAAQQTQNAASNLGILNMAKYVVQLLFGTTATRANAAATLQAAGAQWAYNAAFAAFPLGWVLLAVAAVAGLVAGIIALNNQPSDSEKWEQTNEKLAESAETATEEVNTLKDSLQELSDLSGSLDGLIRSTQEWREALAQNNQQVNELLSKYPELNKYLEVSNDGVLSISEEGQNELLQRETQGQLRSLAANSIGEYQQALYDRDEYLQDIYSGTANLEIIDKNSPVAKVLEEVVKDPSLLDTKVIAANEQERYDYLTANNLGQNDILYNGLEMTVFDDRLLALVKENGLEVKDIFNQGVRDANAQLTQLNNTSKAAITSFLNSSGSIEFQSSEYRDQINEFIVESGVEYQGLEEDDLTGALGAQNLDQKLETSRQINKVLGYNAVTTDPREDIDQYYQEIIEAGGGTLPDDWEEMEGYERTNMAVAYANSILYPVQDELLDLIQEDDNIRSIIEGSIEGNLDDALNSVANNVEISQETKDVFTEKIKQLREEQQAMLDYGHSIFTQASDEDLKPYLDELKIVHDNFENIGKSLKLTTNESQILNNVLGQIDPSKLEKLSDIIRDVSWDSSIDGAAALKNMSESTDESIQFLGASINAMGGSLYNATSQANEFFKSLGEEDLDDLAEDGEISAAALDELSESNSKLSTMLDNTGISTETLADYMNLLNDGVISTEQSFGNFIQVLDKLNAAANVIESSFNFIDNFEADRSSSEIGEYFGDMRETLSEAIEHGAYSDAEMESYFEAWFGEDKWLQMIEEAGGNMRKATERAFSQLNLGETMYGLWQQFAQAGTGMASIGSNGEILFNMDAVGSVENLREQLQKTLQISEDAANAMLADAQTYTKNFKTELNKLSLGEALNEWIASSLKIGDITFLDESQMNAIAREAGIEVDKLKEALESQMDLKVVSLVDDVGNFTSDAIKQIKVELQENSAGFIDLNQVYTAMLDLGLDTSAAEDAMKQLFNNVNHDFENFSFKFNGEVLNDTIDDTHQSLQQAVTNAITSGTINDDTETAAEVAALQAGKENAEQMTVSFMSAWMAYIQYGQEAIDAINAYQTAISSAEERARQAVESMNIAQSASSGNIKEGYVRHYTNLYTQQAQKSFDETINGLLDKSSSIASNYYDSKISQLQSSLGGSYDSSNIISALGLSGGTATAYENANARAAGAAGGTWPDSDADEAEESAEEAAEIWENSFDWLYNLTEDINEQLRIREELEWEYDKAVEDTSKNASDLLENIKAQNASLEEQRRLYNEMIRKRQQEMRNTLSEYSDLSQYGTFNWDDNTIEINWDLINSVTDTDQGERIEEYIGKLEDIQSEIDDANDSVRDVEDAIDELANLGKDEYFDIEERILDAIVNREQEIIDTFSNLNDTINDANDRLLESIRTNLDKIRQDRDNEEAEEDIQANERQLAYLRQDTSGANDAAIRELEEELRGQKEDYTDTLIDQKLNEIEEQNESAAEQREKQITIMEAQLEQAQETGALWNEAYQKIAEGVDATGALIHGSELEALLQKSESFAGMSKLEKMDWLDELTNTVKQGVIYLAHEQQLENIGIKSGNITFTNAKGETLTGTVQSDGSVRVSSGNGYYTYTDVFQQYDGTFHTLEGSGGSGYTSNPTPTAPQPTQSYGGNFSRGQRVKARNGASIYDTYSNSRAERPVYGEGPYYVQGTRGSRAAVTFFEAYKNKPNGYGTTGWFNLNDLYAYKTGGLVDSTGLAWLDGTRKRPEMVLNAKDTENFIELKDILSDLLKGTNSMNSTDSSGDNYYEIHIDVDSISSDYDVEKLSKKVKQIIIQDANYRNVRSVNLLR